MTNEWIDLPDLKAVSKAQADGWEIEHYRRMFDSSDGWYNWPGTQWNEIAHYRGRPAQPKMKKVKMLCYLITGSLEWLIEGKSVDMRWIRVPAQDIEIEIPA